MSSGLVLLFRINRDFFNGSRRRSLVGHDLVKDLAQRLVPETLFELGSVREDVGTVQTRHGPLFVVRLHLDREVRGPGLPDPDQPKAGCPSVPSAGASGHSSARAARRGHGGHTRSSSPHRASRGRARPSAAARAILRVFRRRLDRSRFVPVASEFESEAPRVVRAAADACVPGIVFEGWLRLGSTVMGDKPPPDLSVHRAGG